MNLLFDQFDPAVLRPTVLGVVGHDGCKLTASEGPQTCSSDTVIVDQRLDDCLSPALGELDVAVHTAHVVRVSHDMDLEAGV